MRIPATGRRTLAATVVLPLLVALIATGLAASAATAQVPPSPDLSRAAVVLQFFAAGNDGDVDGMMATVASNASWISGAACPAQNPCQSADAARQVFEANVAAHTSFTVTSIEVLGGTVVGRVQAQSDAGRAAGVDPLSLTIVAQVPQDKITFWVTLRD